MNKVKLRLVTLIGFLALFALVFGFAVGTLPKRASAAEKTYSPTAIFWSRTGGEVKAYKQNADAENAFVTFVFRDGGTVEFHRNLALKWFEGILVDDEHPNTTSYANPGEAKYFSMKFSFGALNFTKFTLEFQSAEENISKEEKAVNRLIFENAGDTVMAYIQNAENAEEEDFAPAEEAKHSVEGSDVEIAFSETGSAGEFEVKVNNESVGVFTNIGGNYLEYRTSGTANTPVTFKAELEEKAEGSDTELTQKVFMTELNGQPLTVTNGALKQENDAPVAEEDGSIEYLNGTVTDTKPAVLVMNEKVYPFSLGQRFSLDYKGIDVLYDSPSIECYYYMLAREKDADTFRIPDEAKGSKDYSSLSTNTYFLPTDDKNDVEEEYVSIRFTLNDGRDTALEEFVYLTWYADLEADYGEEDFKGVVKKVDGNKTTGEGESATTEEASCDFILVNRERKGPSFTVLTATAPVPGTEGKGTNTKTVAGEKTYAALVEQYQDDVTAAASELSSGNGAYYYLPSLRDLIASDYADYRNLRFSIYYYKPTSSTTASSETSLRYNNLRFEVDQSGLYRFRVIASDAAGNAMEYYDEDGELVTVTGDNVWDIDGIPEFTFEVEYKGATIEPAGEQSLGYRGTNYTISSFEIVEGDNSKKEYDLWYLDESKFPEGKSLPAVSDLIENTETYFEEFTDNGLVEIRKYNPDITEQDDDWDDTDNDYAWNPDSSLSFTPQKSGFYIVRLIHTDRNTDADVVRTAYQVIEVRNPIDYIPGQSDWLANNVTSVVLFSISAVLAVIIVILFVVKPSDKNVEEVDLGKLKGRKNKK